MKSSSDSLPWERAIIPEAKIRRYLLDFSHPVGRDKAAFFVRFGFSSELWSLLAEALIQHGREGILAKQEETPRGTRYIVEGYLGSPDGRSPFLRSVWFVDRDGETLRFITAYPLARRAP